MGMSRLLTVIGVAGVIAVGIPPGLASGQDTDTSEAVGTGVFEGELIGFRATGASNEAASAKVLEACRAAGGVDCTVDEVTNDKLCIVSVADDMSDVVAGGAGPTVEAAVADAYARATGNRTPMAPNSPVVISACP